MASNHFGTLFRMTTWGESHGKAVGVVIDGCPAGLEISDTEINNALFWRAPGRNSFTSPRVEIDAAEILSGVFEGKTTGAPISIIIPNKDVDSSKYESNKNLLRPGHANFTYLEKYGNFDYRGGGRASARETVCRVAAGAIAKKCLQHYDIQIVAYIKKIGNYVAATNGMPIDVLHQSTYMSPIFCPDEIIEKEMIELIEKCKKEGDSLGGVIEFIAEGIPIGLGDPVYEKLEAKLAHALLTLPAAKGFEIGSGFASAGMLGSEHNDRFIKTDGKICTETNHAGGVLGGISTGMPLVGKVVFKPTSSIMKPQQTLSTEGNEATLQLPQGSRHDPCVAIRAVPIVESMVALVLIDAILLNRGTRL